MTLAAQMPTVRWQHLLAERVAERVALKLHHRSVPEKRKQRNSKSDPIKPPKNAEIELWSTSVW